MNLSRCKNGHFYDKERYAECPHCGAGEREKRRLTDIFQGKSVPEADRPDPGKGHDEAAGSGTPTETLEKTDIIRREGPAANAPPDNPPAPSFPEEAPGDAGDETVGFYDDLFAIPPAPDPGEPSEPQDNPGQAAVPAPSPRRPLRSPCVGWLVATGGTHLGQDFPLKAGKNFVGRAPDMDVALTGDMSVSRKSSHAIVVYEPKEKLYIIQSGDSSGLVYRNEKVVLTPEHMQAYDVITVGEVNLLFVPLCGDRFSWDDLRREQ